MKITEQGISITGAELKTLVKTDMVFIWYEEYNIPIIFQNKKGCMRIKEKQIYCEVEEVLIKVLDLSDEEIIVLTNIQITSEDCIEGLLGAW